MVWDLVPACEFTQVGMVGDNARNLNGEVSGVLPMKKIVEAVARP